MKKISVPLFIILFQFTFSFGQSPYHTSWKTDGFIFGGAALTAGAGVVLENRVTPLTAAEISVLSRNSVNAIDRGATYNFSKSVSNVSDVCVIAAAMTPGLFIFDNETRKNLTTIGTMYVETMMLAAFLPSIAKGSVQRIRPYAYNPDAPLSDKLDGETKKSFFSGHTTVAFASAVFFSTVYGDYFPDSEYKKYIWAGSLGLAALTGVLRYSAGAHYPSDILVSAVVGSTIGYLIPYLHRKSSSDGSSELIPSLNKSNQFSLRYVMFF